MAQKSPALHRTDGHVWIICFRGATSLFIICIDKDLLETLALN